MQARLLKKKETVENGIFLMQTLPWVRNLVPVSEFLESKLDALLLMWKNKGKWTHEIPGISTELLTHGKVKCKCVSPKCALHLIK